MDLIYDTLTLYESAFLERVPFQLSLHLTGAIHSVITFGNKASSLVLDCFKLINLSFVVRVPHCGSIFKVCVSCRIDTWQIVYLSYNYPCPTISIHKSEIKVWGYTISYLSGWTPHVY